MTPLSASGSLVGGVTTSAKYGLTLVLGPENQIFSCVGSLMQNGVNELSPGSIRLINYPDAEVLFNSKIIIVCYIT